MPVCAKLMGKIVYYDRPLFIHYEPQNRIPLSPCKYMTTQIKPQPEIQAT